MGTTRDAGRHFVKLTTSAVMVLAIAWYAFAPVFVFAEEAPAAEQTCGANPKQPKCNPVCWKKEQCDKETEKGGRWEQNKESDAQCGGSPWGYCYPPNREVTLQVPIGEAKDVADVGKYIKTVYLFALGIGGLVGAIVLIHAGFLWLVSGGNTTTVERAKKHIQDAAIGLLLLFGSYTILSAINPDLVRLRVPKAQLLRNIALEFEPKKVGKAGGVCDMANVISVNECMAACDGCECIPYKEGAMETLAWYVSWAAVGVAGASVGAGGVLAQVGSKLWAVTVKTVPKMLGKLFSLCASGITIGALCAIEASNADDAADSFADYIQRQVVAEPGLCIKPGRNLKKGDLCAFNANCESKKCVGGSEDVSLGQIGICSDGTEGSACKVGDDCVSMAGGQEQRILCVTGPNDTKWCAPNTGRAKGSACGLGHDEPADQCAAGFGCKMVTDEFAFSFDDVGYGWCVDARIAAGGLPQYIGDGCGNGCPGQDRFQELGYTLICIAPPNEAERCTQRCTEDNECGAGSGCPDGQQCSCSNGLCVLGARVAAAPAQVEILQNGGSGCDNQVVRRCADGLICTAGATLYRDGANVRGPAHVCTNKQPGSLCSSNDECRSGRCEVAGEFPNGVPELKCV